MWWGVGIVLLVPLSRVSFGGGLTCLGAVAFKFYHLDLPGWGWMGPAQPSKLLSLFMIVPLLEENCWCLLFRCSKLGHWGDVLPTYDGSYWNVSKHFTNNSTEITNEKELKIKKILDGAFLVSLLQTPLQFLDLTEKNTKDEKIHLTWLSFKHWLIWDYVHFCYWPHCLLELCSVCSH